MIESEETKMANNGDEFTPTMGAAGAGLLAYLGQRPGGISAESRATVSEEALAILRSCAPPTGARAQRTGLVCGYVQSGKTLSIQTVSALAKDNGYRIAVLIAGVTSNLVGQSIDRMDDLRAGAGGYEWVILENPRNEALGQLESLAQEWRQQPNEALGSRMLLVTVMKNVAHLRPLATLFQSVNLAGIPALIFDDEADQASLNTRPSDPQPSPVYEAIASLRAALPHHTLLQYTATPQAPLLISRIDSLSADFAELVSPGDGYTGGLVFFRERVRDLVGAIPVEEIFDHTNLPAEPPPSLIGALQVYFVGVAARYVETRWPTGHRSMLVHPHQRREVHQTYMRWIEALKSDWVRTLSATNDPDRPELLNEFRYAHTKLSRTVQDLPSFEAIAEKLAGAIGRAIPTIVNSDNGREIPWENGYAHILVGGEKLGRGYTVRGLTVTFMPRNPGGWTADTIQQRARFFGYHARPSYNYLDYCRVYLHPDVFDSYVAYIEHEEDMRAQIRRHRGQPLQQLKRAFFLDSQLRATRHNVLRRLYRRPRLSSGWFEQQVPHVAPNGGAANIALVDALRQGLNLTIDDFQRHQYADVNLRDLLENFLIPFSCPDERDEVPMCGIRLVLADIAERDPDSTCRLIFMDSQRPPRERRVDGGTLNIQQGRSSSDDPNSYPGDRHIRANAPNRITVQIHNIRAVTRIPDANGVERIGDVLAERTPALAIRFPAVIAERFRDVIAQSQH